MKTDKSADARRVQIVDVGTIDDDLSQAPCNLLLNVLDQWSGRITVQFVVGFDD